MPLAHTMPHLPQLFSSLNLLMHAPPQSSSGASQSETQVNDSPCNPQSGVGSLHWVTQSPQCCGVSYGGGHAGPPDAPSPVDPRSPVDPPSNISSPMDPSARLASARDPSSAASDAPRSPPQIPATHAIPAPHRRPHAPQWLESRARSTHLRLHSVSPARQSPPTSESLPHPGTQTASTPTSAIATAHPSPSKRAPRIIVPPLL